MSRMSKKDKVDLAEECLNKITELGVKITIKKNWIVFDNTAKIPAETLINLGKCNKEFVEMYSCLKI